MRSLAIETFRRAELERQIEELITLLDLMDVDPDLEEGGDADWSGYEEELPTRRWTGAGVKQAEAMIERNPGAKAKARRYKEAPPIPLVYDFRKMMRD